MKLIQRSSWVLMLEGVLSVHSQCFSLWFSDFSPSQWPASDLWSTTRTKLGNDPPCWPYFTRATPPWRRRAAWLPRSLPPSKCCTATGKQKFLVNDSNVWTECFWVSWFKEEGFSTARLSVAPPSSYNRKKKRLLV